MPLWNLAERNYKALAEVKTRKFPFEGFDVTVQFNPARIVSSGAKTDAASVASRPCFLCKGNRPECQLSVPAGDFELLVNPFPIFSPHFTIAHTSHTPQRIVPYVDRLVDFSRRFGNLAIFYNGPRCGASAPDHMHFQACGPEGMPVVGDYFRLRKSQSQTLHNGRNFRIRTLRHYLRTVVGIEASSPHSAADAIRGFIADLPLPPDANEPMLNMIMLERDSSFYAWIFPRQAFRPWQYSAAEPQRLLVSPATVEMAGIIITPIQEHFARISSADITDIYGQCSLKL